MSLQNQGFGTITNTFVSASTGETSDAAAIATLTTQVAALSPKTTALTGNTSNNLVAVRTVTPSTTNASKTGIVNLGSDTGTNPSTRGASGNYSAILGGDQNTASGDYSVVCGGQTNIASGTQATVIGGLTCTASGNWSIAGGVFCTASGQNSVALGASCEAYGTASLALGYAAQATGSGAAAYGEDAQALADQTTAIGCNAQAAWLTGNVAIGNSCNAGTNGDISGSVAVGPNASATGGSLAIGNYANSSYMCSVAIGSMTSTSMDGQNAIGVSACDFQDGTFTFAQSSVLTFTGKSSTGGTFQIKPGVAFTPEGDAWTQPTLTIGGFYNAGSFGSLFTLLTGQIMVTVVGTISSVRYRRTFFIRFSATLLTGTTPVITLVDSTSAGDTQTSAWTLTLAGNSSKQVTFTVSAGASGATQMYAAGRLDYVEN